MNPLVLVIEDEPALQRLLGTILETAGYRFLCATTTQEGIALAASHQPQAILLDLGLPDRDGLEVIQRVREWSAVPILVLSARAQETDKVHALDAGANDYVTKPFAPLELLARLRVALRHPTTMDETPAKLVFGHGALVLDFAKREIVRHAQVVHLTPIEYKLLHTLVQHRDRVVTHAQLIKAVWGPSRTHTADHVRVHMMQLRHKIEEQPARPRWLLTETGVGYRFRSEPEEQMNLCCEKPVI